MQEKLAPQTDTVTGAEIGMDLRTGRPFIREYRSQIKGQMSIDDYDEETGQPREVDRETGEILTIRKAKN